MSEENNTTAKRAKPTDIISHWPNLFEGLQLSSQDFYAKVEAALAERKVPDLRMERVNWKEGGPLSDRREYLRVTRERLIFDVCGAPFGAGFFVSLWFGKRPLRFGFLAWMHLVVAGIAAVGVVVALTVSWYTLWRLGIRMSPVELASVLAVISVLALIAAVAIVGPDLDQFLIQTPVLGYFYERFFRRITKYRIDLECMYLASVHSAVTEVIDQIGKIQGIPPLSELDRRPIFSELLQRQGGNGRK